MTPSRIKAVLDDLARASARHGVYLDVDDEKGMMRIVPVDDPDARQFAGYVAGFRGALWPASSDQLRGRSDMQDCGVTLATVESIDITQLSNHERIQIIGNRSPDLARMLREAFMAGAKAVVEHRKDEYPEEWWWDDYEGNVEDEATEYAAKIMGGH